MQEKIKDDTISRQAALDMILPYCSDDDGTCSKSGDDLRNLLNDIENLPPAQPEPYIDSIVSEIKKTISETKESGKHHGIRIRTNGEMICFGLQLALEIIEEKMNERSGGKKL